MIHAVQTSNFKMLRSNWVPLGAFQVLVGQNGAGKSTFLDSLQFIADILSKGVTLAVKARAPSILDLCFDPQEPIGLAVDLSIPSPNKPTGSVGVVFRYELEIGLDPEAGQTRVLRENLFLKGPSSEIVPEPQMSMFENVPPIITKKPSPWRMVVAKTAVGNDYFHDEKSKWNNTFKFGADRAALGNLPEDPERFGLSIAVRDLLRDGVRMLALDAAKMRSASAPGGGKQISLDGSNLPYVIQDLKQRDDVLFKQWVEHVALGVPGLTDVSVRERPEDKFLVLEARFAGAHSQAVPSGLLSDGTLRLMALTLISFAASKNAPALWLVEEPENGLHPLAIQTCFDALAAPGGDTQVLCATHSPIFLAHVSLDQALVFKRAVGGTSMVRRGPEVPELRNWSGKQNLADLYATGVLS